MDKQVQQTNNSVTPPRMFDLETFKNVEESIAIFAGKRKANALIALSNINKNIVLITDEESAQAILEQ